VLVDLQEKNWYKVHAATYVQVGLLNWWGRGCIWVELTHDSR
jgi:hypothetical protein